MFKAPLAGIAYNSAIFRFFSVQLQTHQTYSNMILGRWQISGVLRIRPPTTRLRHSKHCCGKQLGYTDSATTPKYCNVWGEENGTMVGDTLQIPFNVYSFWTHFKAIIKAIIASWIPFFRRLWTGFGDSFQPSDLWLPALTACVSCWSCQIGIKLRIC